MKRIASAVLLASLFACTSAETAIVASGVCVVTGDRIPDAELIYKAVNMVAVGRKELSFLGPDGRSQRVSYDLWPSAEAYMQEHPGCCEIYKGVAGDYFTPLDQIANLRGQVGRVVRVEAPIITRVPTEKSQILLRNYYIVFDDCGNHVEDD